MKKILVFLMVVFLSVLFMSCAAGNKKSADKETDKPGAILTNLTTVTATVEAVDYHSRIVTIRGPQGNVFAVHADERVRNFNQVRVGDGGVRGVGLGVGGGHDGRVGEYIAVILVGQLREPVIDLHRVVQLAGHRLLGLP